MSKSIGNIVPPQDIYEKMGADILRLWAATTDYIEDQRIGNDILKQTSDLYRRFRNTLRYMLGALGGLSETERVPMDDQLPELERWVLHRLHEVDAIVKEDLKKYDINHMITVLHNFCNSDLSAFYFDIRKDSLYCDRPDSLRRRAARTIMEQVFHHLTLWLAPVLCFTSEEAWIARFGEKAESIHLQTFPKVSESWQNEALAQKWSGIRAVRRVVTGAMEQARNEKKIGAPLQAHPFVYVTSEQNALLKDADFAGICISSSLTLKEGVPPQNAFTLSDVQGVGVVIELAQGQKCERCWQVLEEVGSTPERPDLCCRCNDAVTHLRPLAA
jgi:isoleucyl-tRNA synthetase